jgi:hypothetical protein
VALVEARPVRLLSDDEQILKVAAPIASRLAFVH